MIERVEDVISEIFDNWKYVLKNDEGRKGDNWFRKKWVTPEIQQKLFIKDEAFIKQFARDLYNAGVRVDRDERPEFDDLSITEAAFWLTKAMVINEKYDITLKNKKE